MNLPWHASLIVIPFLLVAASSTGTRVAFAQTPPTEAAGSPPVRSLPHGATAISEQYDDWTVSCTVTKARKQCLFAEALIDKQTGERALSLEFYPLANGTAEGVLVTPFSLRLDQGVRLAVDGKPARGSFEFLSCEKSGCIVPLTLEGKLLAALKSGTALEFSAVSLDNGRPVDLSLPLTGFSAAMARAASLAK